MTKDEFHALKVGDAILVMGREVAITSVETEYDFSTKPPTEMPWQFQLANGCSLRVSDDLRPFTAIPNS